MSEWKETEIGLIPIDWEYKTIGEIAQLRQGLQISSLQRFSTYKKGRLPLLKITDLPKDEYSEYVENIPQSYIANNDDIIYTRTGQVGLVYTNKNGVVHNNCFKVITDPKSFDKYYLFYFLKSDKVKKYALAVASGSVQLDLTHSAFNTCPIIFPSSLKEQKRIADVLSCLDAKIENLRQQNNTLEQIAQTLFKHWFIDFEFPNTDGKPYKSSGGEMQSSVLGDIPKGWRVGTLGDEFEIIMGQSPAGSSFNQDNQGMVFFQGRTDFGFRFPTVRLYTTEPKRIAEKFDVLVSVRAPVGDVNVASEKCCIGRGLAAVRTKNKSYCLYKMKSYRKIFDVFETEGTVFGSLNKANFNFLESIIPKKTIIDLFESVIFSIDKKIFNNHNQIQTLTKTRDALLPELMSGQIRIEE